VESARSSLAIGTLGTFIALVTYAGPLGNVPTVAQALHAGTDAQTWLLSSVSVAMAASLLITGSVADNSGRRRTFVGGSVALALGNLVCAVAQGSGLFITGRAISGVGAAAILASSLGIVAHATRTPAARARASGWWGAALGAGIAVGPISAGLLDQVDLWRGFYLLLGCAALALAGAARLRLPESRAEHPRPLDVAGAVCLSGAMILTLVALTEVRGGLSSVVVVAGVLAAGLLAAFVAIELGREHPMLDLRLFRQPGFSAATVAALGTGAGVIGLMSFTCTFLVADLGWSSLHAATVLLAWSATSTVTALLARRLPVSVLGSRQLVVGLLGSAVGEVAMLGGASSGGWSILPGLFVMGAASGVLNAGLGREAVLTVPPGQAALGSGANNTARYLGAAIGITMVVLVARQPLHADPGVRWDHAVLVSAVATVVAALAVLALRATRSVRV
jgi:MFS family permease